ncbi:MAG: hypothetical protein AB1772_09965 [Candidatus Zixiibacteriota bacterium]
MILDLVLWFALAYLVVMLVWRFVGRRSSGARDKKTTKSFAERIFGRGWTAPIVVIVIAVGAFFLKAGGSLFGISWSEAERAELEHFVEAIALYQQASEMAASTMLRTEDWETVNAILQAALTEADQVSDNLLNRIDPELTQAFKDNFKSGLMTSIYGLRYYTASPQKGKDTLLHYRMDSINAGRARLQNWNQWFSSHRTEIMNKLD